jgi:hypothetical protein
VKELNSKGEAAFVAEAGDKARVWWNPSGNSEVAKMKPAWFEAAKKRAAAGGAPPESPRRCACLLPLRLRTPLALAVVLKTALSCTSEAPCEREFTERQNAYLNKEIREQAHVGLLLLAIHHRPLADIMRHTNEPRDLPRWGALSLLQKTHNTGGGSAEIAAGLKRNFVIWLVTDL